MNTLLDKYEDPKEALDYSYQNQIETMNKLRRSLAEVVTAKTRLQMQKTKLVENIRTFDEESRLGAVCFCLASKKSLLLPTKTNSKPC